MNYKAATIKSKWDSIFKAADTLKDRIHKIAVITLAHYRQHGDTSLMAYAINGLAKRGTNRRALIQWFERFGKVALVVTGDEVKFVKRDKFDHTKTDLDRAAHSPFYEDDTTDGRTGQDTKSFNVYGRIKSLLKKDREIWAGIDQRQRAAVAEGKSLSIEAAMKEEGYNPEKTKLGDPVVLAKIETLIDTYMGVDSDAETFTQLIPVVNKPKDVGDEDYDEDYDLGEDQAVVNG